MTAVPEDDDGRLWAQSFPAYCGASPANLNELVLQLQWLSHRVQLLEMELARQKAQVGLPRLRKIDYHIGKLYVKELSGTLNIGVSSVDGGVGPPFDGHWEAYRDEDEEDAHLLDDGEDDGFG